VADSAVTVGAILLAWSLSREERENTAARTAPARHDDVASGAPGQDA
jgi:hypothetical protein